MSFQQERGRGEERFTDGQLPVSLLSPVITCNRQAHAQSHTLISFCLRITCGSHLLLLRLCPIHSCAKDREHGSAGLRVKSLGSEIFTVTFTASRLSATASLYPPFLPAFSMTSAVSPSVPPTSAAPVQLLRSSATWLASVGRSEGEGDLPRGSLQAPDGASGQRPTRAGESPGSSWLEGGNAAPPAMPEDEGTECCAEALSSAPPSSTNNMVPRDAPLDQWRMRHLRCSSARGFSSSDASSRLPSSASEGGTRTLQRLNSVLAAMNLEEKLQLLRWQRQESERKCLEFVVLLDRQARAMTGRKGGEGSRAGAAASLCHGAEGDCQWVADGHSNNAHLTACRCSTGRGLSCSLHHPAAHSLSRRRSARRPGQHDLHSPTGSAGGSGIRWHHRDTAASNTGVATSQGSERGAGALQSACAHSWTGIPLDSDRLFYQSSASPSAMRRLRKARSNPPQRRHHRLPLMTSATAHGIPLHMHMHIPRTSSIGAPAIALPASPTHRQSYDISASPSIRSPSPGLFPMSPSRSEPQLSPPHVSPASLHARSPGSRFRRSHTHSSMQKEMSPLSVNPLSVNREGLL